MINPMAQPDLPDGWFREVTGPDGRNYFVIKAVRRGQPLTWENDAWFADFLTILVLALREPFRARRRRTEAQKHADVGGYLVGVVHDGHWRVRIVRSAYVRSPAEVESKLDEYEAAVREGRLR